MKSFFKNFGVFIVFGVFLVVIILNLTVKTPNDRLKKYLSSQGFIYNSDNELIKENISLEEYEKGSNITYNAISYDYNKSTFYLINREKNAGMENIYNLSFNIVDAYMTGDYKMEDEYDTWYIENFLNLKSDDYKCDTAGYKGLTEYCDFLKNKMSDFRTEVNFYLIGSKTRDYYSKKMQS